MRQGRSGPGSPDRIRTSIDAAIANVNRNAKPMREVPGGAIKVKFARLSAGVRPTRSGPDAIAGLVSAYTRLMCPDGTLTSTAAECVSWVKLRRTGIAAEFLLNLQ
jgi:hypothetical protein